MKKLGTILMLALGILIAGTAFGQSIDVTGTLSDFGSVMVTASSAEQSFTVGGTAIPTGQLITVTAPAGFKISLVSGSGYGTSIETPVEDGSGNIPAMTIYVIFSPTAVQAYSANITCTSASVPTQNVAAAGTGIGFAGTFSVGTANVGGEAGHYASLKTMCDALNVNGLSGDVTILITSDLTEAVNIGLGVNTSGHQILIRPDADADRTITFTQATDNLTGPSGGFVIGVATSATQVVDWTKLVTTDSVIVDGYSSAGSTRRLNLVSGAGAHYLTGPISVVGNSNHVQIKNCIVTHNGVASAAASNVYAIALRVRNASTVNYVPDYITIENNLITITTVTAGNGIGITNSGTPTAFATNVLIKNNTVTARHRGIFFSYSTATNIIGNTVSVNQTVGGYASLGIGGNAGNTGMTVCANNKFLQLQTANTLGGANGIRAIQASGGGTWNIYNNTIAGFVTPATGTTEILGIRLGLTGSKIYHNTILIDNLTTTGGGTQPICGIVLFASCDVKNNIVVSQEDDFVNYCIYGGTYLAAGSDYNNYYLTGTVNAKIGFANGASRADIAAWKTVADSVVLGNESHSKNVNVTFAGATDLHLADSYKATPDYNLAGTPIGTVTTDIDGQTRSVTFPYMGADEILEQPLPVELTNFSAATRGNNVELAWSTATETNNAGFSVERKAFGGDWQTVTFIKGQGTSNSAVNYSYSDKVADGRYSYRLKQTDRNGAFTYSSIIEAVVEAAPQAFGLAQNYPNPFNPTTMVRFSVATAQKATLKIYNTAGQEVVTLFEGTAEAGRFYDVPFNASGLASGMYFSVLQTASNREVKKMTLLK